MILIHWRLVFPVRPDDVKWFENRKYWEKLDFIGCERKTVNRKGSEKVSIEEQYFLCSIKSDAELFATSVRRHWHIENNLHWTLDIVFREDKL